MKLVIFSAATGGGHMRAAHTLEQYIHQSSPEDQVTVIDTLKLINGFVDTVCCDGYYFMVRHTPGLFGFLYTRTNRKTPMFNMMSGLTRQFSKKLLKTLEEEQPDAVLSTHPFATEMLSVLKEKGVLKTPLLCLMTDYGPHKAWIAPNVDAYITANGDMTAPMVEMGAPEEKIFPFGIPVGEAFFAPGDKPSLLREFNFTPHLPTVLFMAGSFGVNNILGIYRQLVQIPENFQIVVITGRNQKLYDAFQKEIKGSPKDTRLFYFTDRVADFMHMSDLLITKPGGLTVSEALAAGIPMAVFDAIPGQEEDNANFLIRHGMAIPLKSSQDCAAQIRPLLTNPEQLREMAENCRAFDRSASCRNILETIRRLLREAPNQADTPEL